MKKIIFIILVIILSTSLGYRSWAYNRQETYTYDIDGEVVKLKEAYQLENVIVGESLGIGKFNEVQGLFVSGDEFVYACDSGNNRIIVMDSNFNCIGVIDKFQNEGREDTFNYPTDIFVTAEKDIYIADRKNERIVVLDKNLNCVNEISEIRSDYLLKEGYNFIPVKLVVDNTDRIYVVARGVNEGVMEIDSDGNVKRFMGAARVSVDFTQHLWKILLTREQASKLTKFVPTEYNNLYIDKDNFIYGTIKNVNPSELRSAISDSLYSASGVSLKTKTLTDIINSATKILSFRLSQSGQADMIKKLNLQGDDILRRRGYHLPAGDLEFSTREGTKRKEGQSRFVDVVVNDLGIYSILDENRGRIFTYDENGLLLFVFGGMGDYTGQFKAPSSIEYLGEKIIVTDSFKNSITIFEQTDFTKNVYRAIEEYSKGDYKTAKDYWLSTLKACSNFDIGYIGMGNCFLREENYKIAMDYFNKGKYREGYSKAFELYRKEFSRKNISHILGLFLIAFIIFRIVKLYRKKTTRRLQGDEQSLNIIKERE